MTETLFSLQAIEQCLQQAFEPEYINIIDNSRHHVGHPGAKSGGKHLAVEICSQKLNDLPRVQSHQLIYQALQKWMQKDIHALQIILLRDIPESQ